METIHHMALIFTDSTSSANGVSINVPGEIIGFVWELMVWVPKAREDGW